MDKKTLDTSKKQLKEITEYLKRDDLTIEEREKFELLSAKIAGVLTQEVDKMKIKKKTTIFFGMIKLMKKRV